MERHQKRRSVEESKAMTGEIIISGKANNPNIVYLISNESCSQTYEYKNGEMYTSQHVYGPCGGSTPIIRDDNSHVIEILLKHKSIKRCQGGCGRLVKGDRLCNDCAWKEKNESSWRRKT